MPTSHFCYASLIVLICSQITLTGFSFVIINFITMLWYNPGLDQDMPPWVYLSFSIGLFLYQTFDAVDGSQARRTHQSGPLGELFDHGESEGLIAQQN
jgi:ethanolaminephosphotransferase